MLQSSITLDLETYEALQNELHTLRQQVEEFDTPRTKVTGIPDSARQLAN
ncbi:hypothetical protein [Oscillatoria sp. FACHB-1406]|nr:hypothetical protein [Oscillatoria sp. FACHB-1406]MBD2578857.1 hypothetical protein [Oscillatoria sp. FACHB-1406]